MTGQKLIESKVWVEEHFTKNGSGKLLEEFPIDWKANERPKLGDSDFAAKLDIAAKYSIKDNPEASIRIARVKMYRDVTGFNFIQAKNWVELAFEDYGRGDLKP